VCQTRIAARRLHYLDEVDARLEQAWRLIDRGPAAEEWTTYVPSLEQHLYRWCPLAEELDASLPTNGVLCVASSTEAKLPASVGGNTPLTPPERALAP